MDSPILVAVAGGTRDGRDRGTVEALLDRVRLRRPRLRARAAYLQFAAPSVRSALAQAGGRAVVVPLLLAAGDHLRVELPTALYTARVAAGPEAAFALAPPLGPHQLLTDALLDRLRAAGWRPGIAIVLAAAGTTHARVADEVRVTARELGRRAGAEVAVGFASGAAPTVPQAVRRLRETGARRVALATYLLAPGESRDLAAADADLVAAPLADHDALVRLVLRRYDAATEALGSTTGIKLCAP